MHVMTCINFHTVG